MLGSVTMGEIDGIEIDKQLDNKVSQLAVRHYGDASEASRLRVTEVALKLYYLWINLVEEGGNELEEPIVNWEFADGQPGEQQLRELGQYLFKRR